MLQVQGQPFLQTALAAHLPEPLGQAVLADRIVEVLTPDTRRAILQLKTDTPDGAGIMGIEYYRVVIGGGVRTWNEFTAWRAANPPEGVIEWMP